MARDSCCEMVLEKAHDLRSSMNAIMGFAQLLVLEQDLTDDQAEWAHEIVNASERHLRDLDVLIVRAQY